MAAWAARASGVHIRAAGTTEIPVRSEVSCDQAAQTWNESGTPPAGVHTLSNPSRAASRAAARNWSNGRPSRASSPMPIFMTGSMPGGVSAAAGGASRLAPVRRIRAQPRRFPRWALAGAARGGRPGPRPLRGPRAGRPGRGLRQDLRVDAPPPPWPRWSRPRTRRPCRWPRRAGHILTADEAVRIGVDALEHVRIGPELLSEEKRDALKALRTRTLTGCSTSGPGGSPTWPTPRPTG